MQKQSYDLILKPLALAKYASLALVHGVLRASQLVWNEALAWAPRNATTRKRVLLAIGAVPVMSAVVAFATAPSQPGIDVPSVSITEQLTLALNPDDILQAPPLVTEERIRRGDSVASVLGRMSIRDVTELHSLIRTNKDAKRLQTLAPGLLVSALVDDQGRLLWLRYWHSPNAVGAQTPVLLIERSNGLANGQLTARTEMVEFERQVEVKSAQIRSSLYAATDDADIPDAVANQLADIFSSEIDFHSDLKKGDRLRVIYESMLVNGEPVRSGKILAAEFVNDGVSYKAFLHSDGKHPAGYYNADGKSMKKAFLRTPLEFSRVSSGFSLSRFHPILQNWRAHEGVDYSAPRGTRVRSTADGVVEFLGARNGYGNVVIIKHSSNTTTTYAHLSGFASGLRQGQHVSQGDLIAYVGATGWATGPHLHFEFRVNNVPKNPLTVALPTAQPLDGQTLAGFRRKASEWNQRLALADSVRVAKAQ